MTVSIKFENTSIPKTKEDVADDAIVYSKSKDSSSSVAGVLASYLELTLKNGDKYSDRISAGFFHGEPWRNFDIEVQDDSNIIYKGTVENLVFDIVKNQQVIKAFDYVGMILGLTVEDTAIDTTFTVSGAHDGSRIITLSGSTDGISTPSLVTFSSNLIPRYQIMTVSGNTITLDRSLESPLLGGEMVRISSPKTDTIPNSIKRALLAANLSPSLDNSFDDLHAGDELNGYLVWLFVARESNITLGQHIEQLLKMGNYSLRNIGGLIGLEKSGSYSGGTIREFLTDNEIIDINGSLEIYQDTTNLIFGYNCLYVSGTGIENQTNTAETEIQNIFNSSKFWTPVGLNGEKAVLYSYLYADSVSAAFFGEERLEYYKVPRIRFISNLKKYFYNTNTLISIYKNKEIGITLPLPDGSKIIGEPARVIAFNYNNDRQVLESVEFEFTNIPLPDIEIDKDEPVKPDILESYAINIGVVVVFSPISDSLDFRCDIKVGPMTLHSSIVKRYYQGDGNQFAIFQTDKIINGDSYDFIFYTKRVGVESDYFYINSIPELKYFNDEKKVNIGIIEQYVPVVKQYADLNNGLYVENNFSNTDKDIRFTIDDSNGNQIVSEKIATIYRVGNGDFYFSYSNVILNNGETYTLNIYSIFKGNKSRVFNQYFTPDEDSAVFVGDENGDYLSDENGDYLVGLK